MWVVKDSSETPYSGCPVLALGNTTPVGFVERVWIWLIAKDLTFLTATKSPQEYVRKGVRGLFTT